jgi:hypothetical protein
LSNFTYTGLCTANSDRASIEIDFFNDWRLEFYFYKLNNNTFLFNHVVFYYKFTGKLFPDSLHKGAQSEIYDLMFINSTADKSYICQSGIIMDLGNVMLTLRNFRIEPYFDKRPNQPFEHEISCPSDQNQAAELSASNSVWIVTLIIFLAIISIVFILFIAFRIQSNEYDIDSKDQSKDEKIEGLI